MKPADKAVADVLSIADRVGGGKLNPRVALVQLDAFRTAADIAFKHSYHQKFQKRIPRVAFFDSSLKPAITQEEKVKVAARTLAKSKRK